MNERSYDRLVGLLNQTRGKIVRGGKNDREDRYIPPTVITEVNMHGKLYSLVSNVRLRVVFPAANIIHGQDRS